MRRKFNIRRILAWVFWLGFFLMAGGDGLRSLQDAKFETYAFGEILYAINPPILNLVEAVTERYIHLPMLLILGVLAVLFTLLSLIGRGGKKHRYGRSALSS